MDDGLNNEFFHIDLSDDETGGATPTPGSNATSATTSAAAARAARMAQSEEEHVALKKEYRVKVDNGEIWRSVELPLQPGVSKPAAQMLVHAVEELYFFRRYAEAAAFVRRVMDEGNGGVLDGEVRQLMEAYERRSLHKLNQAAT